MVGGHSTPLTLFRGATPTALRGRVFERPADSHAHAKPWAWHPDSEILAFSRGKEG